MYAAMLTYNVLSEFIDSHNIMVFQVAAAAQCL